MVYKKWKIGLKTKTILLQTLNNTRWCVNSSSLPKEIQTHKQVDANLNPSMFFNVTDVELCTFRVAVQAILNDPKNYMRL